MGFAFLLAASIVRNFSFFTGSKKLNIEPTLNPLMNCYFSDRPRSSTPNLSFSTSILTGDQETREYNLFLSETLHGFAKIWMAGTTFKTAPLLFYIWNWCNSRCLPSLGASRSSNKPHIFSAFS